MAEAVPNGLSIQQDALAELRAKKQRQLSATPPAPPAALQPAATLPGTVADDIAPTPADPSAMPPPSLTLPSTSVEQSTMAAPKARRPRAASPRPDRDGQVMISGYFPVETRRRLKIVAARQDKTLQQVMAEAFEAWLRRHEKEG